MRSCVSLECREKEVAWKRNRRGVRGLIGEEGGDFAGYGVDAKCFSTSRGSIAQRRK